MKTDQDELAAKFLLGKLNDEEQVKIEENYFKNTNFFENILVAENELIDAYVSDNLSSEDRLRFENRLLLNPQQRQKVDFAKTLLAYASNQPLADEESSSASSKSKWSFLFSRFIFAQPVLSYSLAALIIFLAGGIWLTVNSNLEQGNQLNELAEIHSPQPMQNPEAAQEFPAKTNPKVETDENAVPAPQVLPEFDKSQPPRKNRIEQPKNSKIIISTIVLSLGSVRDIALAKTINISPKANFVNIRLEFEQDDFAFYCAVLETVEGRQVWRQKMLKPRKEKNERVVILTVPARLLRKSDYVVTLKGLTKDGIYEEVGDYSFSVAN